MITNESGLNPKQERFIALRLTGMPEVEVAKLVGISSSGFQKWKTQPVFRKAMAEEASRVYEETMLPLVSLVDKAVKTIDEVMTTGTNREKLKACELVLNNLYRMSDLSYSARLVDLEQKLGIN